MRTRIGSLVAGFALMAGAAQATVTLQFSQQFSGGIASGFSTQSGADGVNGLKWGIIVDTNNDGFAGNGTAYFPMTAGPDTAAFMRVDGATDTDDYFIPATTLTQDYSALKEGGGVISGGKGTIGNFPGVPMGTHGITPADHFAIVWFNTGTTGAGDRYGFFTHASFNLPADGSTSPFDTPFVGVDPVRNASIAFSSASPQEIAVFNGASTAPGDERTDNVGTVGFGAVTVGASSGTQTFTIKNVGTGPLSGIAVSKSATGNPADFAVDTGGMLGTLAPDGTTTFTVTFVPTLGGARNAVIKIASNDADENPFEIAVNGTGAGLALNSGLSVLADDPAQTATAQAGSLVTYSINVAASAGPSLQTVVWAPIPAPSNPSYPLTLSSISAGGNFTAGGTLVGSVSVPANSVYWNLGDLAVADGISQLAFTVLTDSNAPSGVTYTTAVMAHTSTQSDIQDSLLTLTLGVPNRPPHNGTVTVTPQTVAGHVQVGVVFSSWADPEGDSPLAYGIRRVEAGGGGQTVVVADGALTSLSFTVPADPTSLNYVARVKDSLGHVREVPFTVAVPEIAVEAPGPVNLADGGTVDFGNVGTGVAKSLTFTIRNLGAANLTGLAITKDGANAAMFTVTTSPKAPVVAGGSTTFVVKFLPTSVEAKTAKLHIASNDADETPFDITLIGAGTPSSLPVVTTLAATPGADPTLATLNGTVNALNNSRDVTFEYGTTTTYGTKVTAAPATVTGNGVTPVSADLTGLKAHTKYNFRVVASSDVGSANGANLTFTTGNRAPIAAGDDFAIVPGTKATLAVLANDSEPDGDILSIASFTPLSTPSAGTLAKSGTNMVFTAAAGFSGPVSFTYTASDGFGMTATATVNLTVGNCVIDPPSVTKSSAPVSYNVTVTTTAAWAVSESLAWVTATPASGVGNGVVTITLQGNATKNQRVGTVMIGGQAHSITQDPVVAPTVTAPAAPIAKAVVSGAYSLPVTITGFPVTVTVTDLPPGLKMDPLTGIISGTPTKAKVYHVGVKVTNAAGSASLATPFDLEVLAIPDGAIGTFHGLVDREPVLNGNMGSRIEVVTTALGSYTGKIITGTASVALKGQLAVNPLDTDHPVLNLSIPRTGTTPLALSLNLEASSNTLDGTLADNSSRSSNIRAWRNGWSTTRKASNYNLLHTFRIEQPAGADLSLPQGYGFGSFTVTENTGALTVSGKLPDGSGFSTITFLGQAGQVLIYQPLFTNKGSLAGSLVVTPGVTKADNKVETSLDTGLALYKPASLASAKDTVYSSGFGPIDLEARGSAYTPPAKGTVVMGLDNVIDNAALAFSSGGLPAAFEVSPFDLLNPSATGVTNKATLPTFASGENPNKVNLPTVTPATGLFNGDFTIAGPDRKVTFFGQIVTIDGLSQGYGFFLLPRVPGTGETVATAPKLSGKVELKAAP